MITEKDCLAAILCFNTVKETKKTLEGIPKERNYDVLIVNDGSTDSTKEIIEQFHFNKIHHERNKGVGSAIKTAIHYASSHGYKVIAILAGNNKDDPSKLDRLISPIIKEGFDYVQGSRFLPGGSYDNLPIFRNIMIRLHAFLFFLITGFKGTDALNGFRAYRLDIFKDSRINIFQDWLDRYELETYIHYKVLKLGYKVKEVPVSKTYPENKMNVKYSHIRPIIDWWIILRPLVFLLPGLRK